MDELSPSHLEWIAGALTRLGLEPRSEIRPFKIRPWSSVAFLETDRGRVWFKANEPALSFEAELLIVLARVAPGRVPEPLDHDTASGWFLTADAGLTGTERPVDVYEAIDTITTIQRESSTAIDDVLATGTPDRRPAVLPGVLDEAIAHPASGRGGRRCAERRGAFTEVCDLLAADGRLAVVNSDHKPDHVFAGPPLRIYDWGDAAVCHPLADLPHLDRHFGGGAGDHFAERWGHARTDPLVAAGWVVAELIEADVWLRTSPAGLARHPDGIDVALGRLADHLDTIG